MKFFINDLQTKSCYGKFNVSVSITFSSGLIMSYAGFAKKKKTYICTSVIFPQTNSFSMFNSHMKVVIIFY